MLQNHLLFLNPISDKSHIAMMLVLELCPGLPESDLVHVKIVPGLFESDQDQ